MVHALHHRNQPVGRQPFVVSGANPVMNAVIEITGHPAVCADIAEQLVFEYVAQINPNWAVGPSIQIGLLVQISALAIGSVMESSCRCGVKPLVPEAACAPAASFALTAGRDVALSSRFDFVRGGERAGADRVAVEGGVQGIDVAVEFGERGFHAGLVVVEHLLALVEGSLPTIALRFG